MNDSDGSHSCRHTTEGLTSNELDDAGPRCICVAATEVNGRLTLLRKLP